MSQDNMEFDDNKKESQYYVEGYYDPAISVPAESNRDCSYKASTSAALPAFPPHGQDKSRQNPFKIAIFITFCLFVLLCILILSRFFYRYDIAIRSENGTINITLTESNQEIPSLSEVFPPATPQGNVSEGNEVAWLAPDDYRWSGAVMAISEVPDGAETLTYQQIYKRCINSMVSVYAICDNGQMSGTGIVISSDGYILTNAHIVGDSSDVFVVLNNREQYQALLVGRDSVTDLAVLKINANNLKPIEFGNSADVEVGDCVLAIGNPLNHTLMMTDGIISAINDKITLNGYKTTLLQTNAELSDGSSGGALINCYGQVIGITNMKIVSVGASTTDDIGFAFPVVAVKPIVEELLVSGYIKGRPSLGITVKDVPKVVSIFYEMPSGVYVDYIWDNSEAYKKGIMRGDIIVSANGTQIKSQDSLLEIQNGLKVGDTVVLDIFRQGQYFVQEITLMDASSFY